MTPPRQLLYFLLLICCTMGEGLCAENPLPTRAPVRVVSQTVGTDELLLALAEPEQVAALSHLARETA